MPGAPPPPRTLGLGAQLSAALVGAPAAPLRLRGRARTLLLLYVLLAGALLGGLAAALLTYQEQARAALLGHVLPRSWIVVAELLINRFLATQTRAVLVNALVTGTLVAISVLLFPLKERLGAAFERGAGLTDGPPRELPLRVQAGQELKLLLLYLALQLSIVWLGYPPDPARQLAATLLSYLLLFFSFAVDFIGPLLQRHGLRYSQILKTLLRRPLASLAFGAFFSAPAVTAGLLVARTPALPFSTAVLVLFGANLVSIRLGLSGGHLARRAAAGPGGPVPPLLASRPRPDLCCCSRCSASTALMWLPGTAMALHCCTQRPLLLSAATRLGARVSSASPCPRLAGLLRGRLRVGVAFRLQIDNPTRFDLAIEDNRLQIRHRESRWPRPA